MNIFSKFWQWLTTPKKEVVLAKLQAEFDSKNINELLTLTDSFCKSANIRKNTVVSIVNEGVKYEMQIKVSNRLFNQCQYHGITEYKGLKLTANKTN